MDSQSIPTPDLARDPTRDATLRTWAIALCHASIRGDLWWSVAPDPAAPSTPGLVPFTSLKPERMPTPEHTRFDRRSQRYTLQPAPPPPSPRPTRGRWAPRAERAVYTNEQYNNAQQPGSAFRMPACGVWTEIAQP